MKCSPQIFEATGYVNPKKIGITGGLTAGS